MYKDKDESVLGEKTKTSNRWVKQFDRLLNHDVLPEDNYEQVSERERRGGYREIPIIFCLFYKNLNQNRRKIKNTIQICRNKILDIFQTSV